MLVRGHPALSHCVNVQGFEKMIRTNQLLPSDKHPGVCRDDTARHTPKQPLVSPPSLYLIEGEPALSEVEWGGAKRRESDLQEFSSFMTCRGHRRRLPSVRISPKPNDGFVPTHLSF